ncbi:MAG TPA: hypothetical protein VFE59_34220 [Trebonia sp.]|nr:hypothetical protein [Trebonia sp.]
MPGARGFLDDAGINSGELELAAADQLQGAIAVHVTPSEEQVPVGGQAGPARPARPGRCPRSPR